MGLYGPIGGSTTWARFALGKSMEFPLGITDLAPWVTTARHTLLSFGFGLDLISDILRAHRPYSGRAPS